MVQAILATPVAALSVLAAGIAGFAIAPAEFPALAAMAIAGAGFIVAITSITTQLQELVPDPLRGRVMALWGVAFLGIRPISATIDGALADLSSPEVAGIAMAAAALAAAAVQPRESPQNARSSGSTFGTSEAIRPMTPRKRRSSG